MVCGSGLWPLEAGCRRTSRKRAEYREESTGSKGTKEKNAKKVKKKDRKEKKQRGYRKWI